MIFFPSRQLQEQPQSSHTDYYATFTEAPCGVLRYKYKAVVCKAGSEWSVLAPTLRDQ